jgi:hypothetical protein
MDTLSLKYCIARSCGVSGGMAVDVKRTPREGFRRPHRQWQALSTQMSTESPNTCTQDVARVRKPGHHHRRRNRCR